jgi:energy-coupling factor transporter ATP-binding protein EcfA2
VSRRQARLYNDLSLLASALRELDVEASLSPTRDEAIALLDHFLLPRIMETPPLIVALVGSTGAGKSTLLNSLAGEIVSAPGALRPTTKRARVWSSEAHANRLADLGPVSIGNHPLLEHLALVDTPDLDSDLVGHRAEALAVSRAADLVLFVTTAARYGDRVVWTILESLAASRPLAVILNRVPARSSGARNDLLARLRAAGLSHLPVFTISEQRIDPDRNRLRHQSVARLAAYLRQLPTQDRARTLERVADRVAELVEPLRAAAVTQEASRRAQREQLEAELGRLLADPILRGWRPFSREVRMNLRQRIERKEAELASIGKADGAKWEDLEAGWQALVDARLDQ